MKRHAAILLAATGALVACTSAGQQARNRETRTARATLERLDSIGDPGRVAAADFAFAKMAREEGQWTAFRTWATDDAVIHGRNGPIAAGPWLAGQSDPDQSVAWTPNTVWSSCDGTLAVSFGRLRNPDGKVGSYVTTWELQGDRNYKWTYDIGALDDPQPPAPPADADIPADSIVVAGLSSIEGRVADCPQDGIPLPPPPLAAMAQGVDFGGASARDGSLSWTWTHAPDGTRAVSVLWYREGSWQKAVDFAVPPSAE
ncbi:MAG: hypothetical protein WBA68_11000 [Alteraurantiacibacter sp.]